MTSIQLALDGQTSVVGGRPSDDFYRTPTWVTQALLAHLPIPVAPLRILDAGAGDGAIGRVLEARWPGAGIWAVEQDADRLDLCPPHWGRLSGDFLTWDLPPGWWSFDLAISNPPFGIGGEDTWTAWALKLRTFAPWSAVLGFANVLGGSNWDQAHLGRHQRLWSRFPPTLIIHVGRAQFRQDTKGSDPRDCLWIVWGPDRVEPGQTRFVWAG